MLVDLVAERLPGLGCHRVKGRLDTVGQVDVVESSAARADQVMMVARQLLGQLEACDTVRGRQADDDRTRLEHAEVAVEGALGPGATTVDVAQQLSDGQGTTCPEQHVHQGAPTTGVALPPTMEAVSDDGVQIFGHTVRVGEAAAPPGCGPTVRLRPRPAQCAISPASEAPVSRTRTLRGVLALGVASLMLVGCSSASTSPVATVDGVEIPREPLEGWVRTGTDANDQVDPVSMQAELLARVVQQRIIDGLLAERGLTVDPALLDEIRESITAQVGGALALEATLIDIGFPQDYFDNVFLAVEASMETLVLSLVDGRTLETRTARHILVSTAEEADEIVALLQDGADFGALAIERSADTGSGAQGGDLGPQQRGAFVPPFDDAVWSGRIGTVLAPVESEFGFHVIEVTAIDTKPASELSSQERRRLAGAELEEVMSAAFQAAVVTVDPTIGVWDPLTGAITPAS